MSSSEYTEENVAICSRTGSGRPAGIGVGGGLSLAESAGLLLYDSFKTKC